MLRHCPRIGWLKAPPAPLPTTATLSAMFLANHERCERGQGAVVVDERTNRSGRGRWKGKRLHCCSGGRNGIHPLSNGNTKQLLQRRFRYVLVLHLQTKNPCSSRVSRGRFRAANGVPGDVKRRGRVKGCMSGAEGFGRVSRGFVPSPREILKSEWEVERDKYSKFCGPLTTQGERESFRYLQPLVQGVFYESTFNLYTERPKGPLFVYVVSLRPAGP